MIAALYIDPRGPYPRMLGAPPCWDELRDACRYDGPWPIVAHPDCGPWGKLRHLYRGHGHHCAPRAVEQVRRWGGVLEHPASSRLWAHAGLPRPGEERDRFGGWTIEVCQVDWGHVARKRTWLYLVGVDPVLAAARPCPREPTHWASGFRRATHGQPSRNYSSTGCAVPPGVKVCSAEQRRRTPPLFAAWLVSLAESVRPRRWPRSRLRR